MKAKKPLVIRRKKKPFPKGPPHKNKRDKRAKENKNPDWQKEHDQ